MRTLPVTRHRAHLFRPLRCRHQSGKDGSTLTAVNGKLISQLDFENLTGTDRGRKSAGDSNDRKSEVRNPFCCDVAVCAGAAQPGLSN